MRAINLEAVELGGGALISHVSGVQGRFGLKQDDLGFLFGERPVLHATRDDDEFAGADADFAVPQLHPHAALHDEKHLVLVVVMMPDELALELHELDQAVVHLADDLGLPLILKPPKHLRQIDRANHRGHDARSSTLFVSNTVANSRCRSASATSCNSAEGYRFPSGPVLSNVAVASDTTYVVNPRLPAIRAVVETHMLVWKPTTTSVVMPRRRRSASSVVPMNALLTEFCTTGSPGSGRTSSLISTPGWPGRSGDCGSLDRCWTWTIGRPDLRHAACSRAMLRSRSGLLRLYRSAKTSIPFWTSTTRRTASLGSA